MAVSAAATHAALRRSSAVARSVSERDMASRVRIFRPARPTFDETTGRLQADPDAPVVYEGIAHVSTASGPITYDIGDGPQFFSSAAVSIPVFHLDGDLKGQPTRPQVHDLVTILDHADPAVVGRTMDLVDVEAAGSLTAARRLQAVGIQRAVGTQVPW